MGLALEAFNWQCNRHTLVIQSCLDILMIASLLLLVVPRFCYISDKDWTPRNKTRGARLLAVSWGPRLLNEARWVSNQLKVMFRDSHILESEAKLQA
jgi:hypothetical protein